MNYYYSTDNTKITQNIQLQKQESKNFQFNIKNSVFLNIYPYIKHYYLQINKYGQKLQTIKFLNIPQNNKPKTKAASLCFYTQGSGINIIKKIYLT